MRQFDFRLDIGDRNVGTVYLPTEATGPLPVMIYCHGWGGHRGKEALGEPVLTLRDSLLPRGMALVTFDFFGCGDTGGDYADMTYGRWMVNLADVAAWVVGQPWADPGKIGALGISSGTTPSLRLAEDSDALAFVISIATCLGLFINMPNCPPRIFAAHRKELIRGGRAEIFGIPFPIGFFLDFIGNAPVYRLNAMRCPVFFLQGAADNPWRRSDAWIGYTEMQKHDLPVKHREVEGGDHALSTTPARCSAEVIGWLQEIGIL